MKKVIFMLVLLISTISLFAQKPPLVPNYPVPDNPDVYAEDKESYDFGYRLGKMYALKNDVDNYKWACNSTADSRNQYPSQQSFYENKLLGIVAGWMDNRIPVSTKSYIDIKNLMRQPHEYKWDLSWHSVYGIQIARIWLP